MRHLAYLIASAVALGGCLPEPAYPDVPSLAFVALEPGPGAGRTLVLEFTDGDEIGRAHV